MIVFKSKDALSKRRKKIWYIIRSFCPLKTRWFFEGHPKIRGQLWLRDRKLIYETVLQYKPNIVFEIGTWYGGGSTHFISQALFENRYGLLHTIETNPEFFKSAKENYKKYLPHLLPYVEFHLGGAMKICPKVLKNLGKVDMLFLDGAPDAQQTLSQFKLFLPYLKHNSVLIAHDWCNEKMAKVRPVIEKSSSWYIKEVIKLPHSLGLAIITRR